MFVGLAGLCADGRDQAGLKLHPPTLSRAQPIGHDVSDRDRSKEVGSTPPQSLECKHFKEGYGRGCSCGNGSAATLGGIADPGGRLACSHCHDMLSASRQRPGSAPICKLLACHRCRRRSGRRGGEPLGPERPSGVDRGRDPPDAPHQHLLLLIRCLLGLRAWLGVFLQQLRGARLLAVEHGRAKLRRGWPKAEAGLLLLHASALVVGPPKPLLKLLRLLLLGPLEHDRVGPQVPPTRGVQRHLTAVRIPLQLAHHLETATAEDHLVVECIAEPLAVVVWLNTGA
mmetsp:Transcript_99036/g.275708  ORF Transcript_99036/g.275708 Transcript_99036/m.275708 type:complete len:285 (-) Transcript_99036:1046-1900(-)